MRTPEMAKRHLSTLLMASPFGALEVANKEKPNTRRFNYLSKLRAGNIKGSSFITFLKSRYNYGQVVNKDNVYPLNIGKVLDLFYKTIRIHRPKMVIEKETLRCTKTIKG
jgi:hypothetical protein